MNRPRMLNAFEMQVHDKAYQSGREKREEEIIDLIYFFEKTWNKESHKRVPHIAIYELIEFIMQNDTTESVDRWVKEQG